MKQKYVASYEAILPISTSADRQDINSEECLQFICVPIVDETSPDYAEGDTRVVRRCPEPKCPKGYMIRLQIQKDATHCAKYDLDFSICLFWFRNSLISSASLDFLVNRKLKTTPFAM